MTCRNHHNPHHGIREKEHMTTTDVSALQDLDTLETTDLDPCFNITCWFYSTIGR